MVVTMEFLACRLRALSQCLATPVLRSPQRLSLFRWVSALGLACSAVGLLPALPSQSLPAAQSASCDVYVDNAAASNGDGSLAQPWPSLAGHLGLAPGQSLCVRGDVSGNGRVYFIERLDLNSNGTAAAPLVLRPYPGEQVILRGTGDGPMLRFNGDYWIVEGFKVDNNASTWRAVILDTGSAHNTLRNNEIYNGLNNGVDIREDSVDNVIEDNHIHHFNHPTLLDSHCIQINPRANRNLIQRNTIHDCSGDGLQLIPPIPETDIAAFADGNRVLNNVFYRGTLPRVENAIDIKAAKNLTVAGNDMSGYTEHPVIVLQKTSRNLLFDSNVIHDSISGLNLHAEGLGWPDGITVRNNILYNLAEFGILLMGIRNGAFVHNTFVNVGGKSIYVAGTGLFTGAIRNNLMSDSAPGRLKPGAVLQDVVLGPNGWFNSSTEWPGAGDITRAGSPGFENATAHNYRLRADSFALDQGADIGVLFDFEGDVRPSHTHPDLGADEYPLGLRLSAAPQDGALRLWWTAFHHDDLANYEITYAPGSSSASPAAVVITGLPADTRSYLLSGLTNYQSYVVTVTALDHNTVELGTSNSVVMMPSDRFVYLPLLTGFR